MCGILGYSLHSDCEILDKSIIESAISQIHHRGPDNTGFWFNNDQRIGLAHKRLSILDISDDGNQPMVNSHSDMVISFNGEIYNYQEIKRELIALGYSFNSSSDTEVLLCAYEAWGTDMFKFLEGMFAFVICDLKKNKLLLVRDGAGEKPLFYSLVNKSIFFSSEIKALLDFPVIDRDINIDGLNHLFSRGYSSHTQSIFSNILKLDAGNYLEYDMQTRKTKISEFWSLEQKMQESSPSKTSIHRNPDYLISKLENLLESSIDKQLNADVPVGMLLSGGVDSSILVALAARNRNQLDTFTVKFADHASHDESLHAKQIAEKFGCTHHEIEASSFHPSIFDELSEFYDDPIFDTSMIPTFLLAQSVSKHLKVAIGGDGGDELFGGYPHYNKLLSIHQKTKYVPFFLRKNIAAILSSFMPTGFKGKQTLSFYGTDLSKHYPNIAEFYNFDDRKSIFNNKNINIKKIGFSSRAQTLEQLDIIDRGTFFDFQNYLREDLLVKIDRASMANSLEIRSPFLDKSLVEFAFTEIPSSLKVSQGQRKILLKQLAEKVLPSNFDLKRKQGFSLPLRALFQEPLWKEYFYQKTSDADPYIFNKNSIFKLINSLGATRNNEERVAGLIFFMCWVERFKPNF